MPLPRITYLTKALRDLFTFQNANEIKQVVNAIADQVDASSNIIQFEVGTVGAPEDGGTLYTNQAIAGKNVMILSSSITGALIYGKQFRRKSGSEVNSLGATVEMINGYVFLEPDDYTIQIL